MIINTGLKTFAKMDEKIIDQLIKDVIVDCYDQEECQSSFVSALEDNLSYPFPARIGKRKVLVVGMDNKAEYVKVIVQDEVGQFTVDILDLEIDKEVGGYMWVSAYRKWNGGF